MSINDLDRLLARTMRPATIGERGSVGEGLLQYQGTPWEMLPQSVKQFGAVATPSLGSLSPPSVPSPSTMIAGGPPLPPERPDGLGGPSAPDVAAAEAASNAPTPSAMAYAPRQAAPAQPPAMRGTPLPLPPQRPAGLGGGGNGLLAAMGGMPEAMSDHNIMLDIARGGRGMPMGAPGSGSILPLPPQRPPEMGGPPAQQNQAGILPTFDDKSFFKGGILDGNAWANGPLGGLFPFFG